ncbi:hypothetical protein BJY52DRAFT_1374030 [Lactarius psammicola]|nr:hypothetical protein BJY52DRAFT_1374030 [Lactarius psammicola]
MTALGAEALQTHATDKEVQDAPLSQDTQPSLQPEQALGKHAGCKFFGGAWVMGFWVLSSAIPIGSAVQRFNVQRSTLNSAHWMTKTYVATVDQVTLSKKGKVGISHQRSGGVSCGSKSGRIQVKRWSNFLQSPAKPDESHLVVRSGQNPSD